MTKFRKQFYSFLAILSFFIIAIASSSSDSEMDTKTDEWYVGGTLHQSTSAEWNKATEKNKLATCADFVANIKELNNESYAGDTEAMKRDAIALMICINETVKGDDMSNLNLKISEIAVSCLILMDNIE